MKKYILMGLLLFSIGAIKAQIQVDSLIAKQKIKLHGYYVTGVSNDTNLTHKDSSKLITEYAAKKIVENDTAFSIKGEEIVSVVGTHQNPYAPNGATIKTLNLHNNYIDSVGAIRLDAVNGYWGDTVLDKSALLLAYVGTDSSANPTNGIVIFPSLGRNIPVGYVAYRQWVLDYLSTHGGSGSSFDTSKNQTITGDWTFAGGFTVDDGENAAGFKTYPTYAVTSVGDWDWRNNGTRIEVADNDKAIKFYSTSVEGWMPNQSDVDVRGWGIHSDGKAYGNWDFFENFRVDDRNLSGSGSGTFPAGRMGLLRTSPMVKVLEPKAPPG